MKRYYLLWATGADKPGIVAAVTNILFDLNTNLEDSSMMRLGSEFAMFIIFTSTHPSSKLEKSFSSLERKWNLDVGLKELTRREARFASSRRNRFLVSVHGQDRPGIVYRVTSFLAKYKFNISDLSTHRTTKGAAPGYILFIEGELQNPARLDKIRKGLALLQKSLHTKISVNKIQTDLL